MTASSQEPHSEEIEVGALARDTDLDRVGVVMGRAGAHYQLRPIRGGTAWNVRPEAVQPLNASDLLREKVRQVNRRSAGGLA
ncbi:hypothetical protein [Streptomyces sp. NBC_01803]|uniref:hypothetical protein n=1 Tax=Streptomyces sp. NBC_01803 TaxID=2975946 RepID=UPI002DDB9832|nr:hypothetical protein [Streptomyces sp. NBC_01803]WSA44645.1 hypothetical protein OIE51_10765 [Streptomyces sp. NBC_01803]